jgi:hypothetical protein
MTGSTMIRKCYPESRRGGTRDLRKRKPFVRVFNELSNRIVRLFRMHRNPG